MQFSERAHLVEHMDRPDCCVSKLYRTLDQFAWINFWLSRYRSLLRRYVLRDMLREPRREWRLVDLGAGGCDITVWILRQAARRGLRVKATALDYDQRIITYARAKHGDCDGLNIVAGDALDRARWEPVDYVFANHFLHHLENAEIIRLLRLAGADTRRLFAFSDIRRCRAAYWSYAFIIRLLAHRSFAPADGLMSIRRGFSPAELRSLLETAQLEVPSRVQTLFPFRVAVIGGPALSSQSSATD